VAGLVVFVASAWQRRIPMLAGLAVVVLGLLLMPAAWSGHETAHASLNTTLPQAGPRGGAAGRSFGSAAFDNGTADLAAWLEAHDDTGARWDLAVSSAMNASTLIADYGLSVMPLGGFSGRDPTLTPDDFAALVASGEARYVLASNAFGGAGTFDGLGGGIPGIPGFGQSTFGRVFGRNGSNNGINRSGGFGGGLQPPNSIPAAAVETPGANAVLAAVRSACEPLTDPSIPAQYRGQLYDCAGYADSIGGQ